MATITRPANLLELRQSGWVSKPVKREIYDNFMQALVARRRPLSRHHRLRRHGHPGDQHRPDRRARPAVPGRKGAGQEPADAAGRPVPRSGAALSRHSRLSGARRPLPARSPAAGRRMLAETAGGRCPSPGGRASKRYAERLAPGTKFADVIGEIDPARLAGGTSMSAEEALHFGLIPRMHRGIFAMNELPELDELVQVGLFNILEERDVQIRGYPVRFDIDVLILFSANPATYNRSGKVIPQLKDRIGSVVHTHYPRDRATGIEIIEQEAGDRPGRGVPRGGAVLHAGDRRGDEHRRAAVEVPRPAVGRERPASASPTIEEWWPAPGSAGPCSASGPPCRGSATWGTFTPPRWESWRWT